MNFILEVRTKLNCSQTDLARLLGTNRTNVSRIERSDKWFGGEMDEKINWLGNGIRKAEQEEFKASLNNSETALKEYISRRNQAIEVTLSKLKEEFNEMEGLFNKALAALQYYKVLLEMKEGDAQFMHWLEEQKSWHEMIIKKNDPTARHQAYIRIAQLEMELKMNLEALKKGA